MGFYSNISMMFVKILQKSPIHMSSVFNYSAVLKSNLYNQVLNKIKIVVRILSQKGRI